MPVRIGNIGSTFNVTSKQMMHISENTNELQFISIRITIIIHIPILLRRTQTS